MAERLQRPEHLLPVDSRPAGGLPDHPRLPVAVGHRLVLVLARIRRAAPAGAADVAAPVPAFRRLPQARSARQAARPDARHRLAARRSCEESVIQDVEIPVTRSAEFYEFFAANVGMSPVWLCPLRLRADRAWPLYPLQPDEVYVNFGFWGNVTLPPGAGDGFYNRQIEDKVTELGGHKGLYSTSYYSPRGVLEAVQRPRLRRFEARVRPRRPSCQLVRQMRRRQVGRRVKLAGGERRLGMPLAEVFEGVAGPDAEVEFVAYDGSRAGQPGSPPVTFTVKTRSPCPTSPRRRARWAWPGRSSRATST